MSTYHLLTGHFDHLPDRRFVSVLFLSGCFT
nr:MAG TPA: lipoprotein [Caudoviricetes sp.]